MTLGAEMTGPGTEAGGGGGNAGGGKAGGGGGNDFGTISYLLTSFQDLNLADDVIPKVGSSKICAGWDSQSSTASNLWHASGLFEANNSNSPSATPAERIVQTCELSTD